MQKKKASIIKPALSKKEEELRRKEEDNRQKQEKLDRLCRQQQAELEKISNMTMDEAKSCCCSGPGKITHEMAIMVKEVENQAKSEAEKRAREVVTMAIQRCAADPSPINRFRSQPAQ